MVKVNSTEILFEFDMLPKPAWQRGCLSMCVTVYVCERENDFSEKVLEWNKKSFK